MANVLQSNERSVRSVFVGNIPYDATEEKLKDIFNEVGPVVSFRLVYDRETGKPKGYGFCEYRDQETAMSAMRNLNGYDLNNRILRVDNAANEKTKEEIRNLQTSINGLFESPYGPEVNSETAPEEISKAVASLPPEQMFELAKQMKQCVANNPTEAKNMLIQNPQLCYGLLQALVVMRVVDPNVASKMLYRNNPPVKPLKPQESSSLRQPAIPSLTTSQLPQNVPSWTTQTDQFGRQIPQPTAVLQPTAVASSVTVSSITSATPSSAINSASSQSSFDPRMYNRLRDIPSNNLDPRVRQQSQAVQPTAIIDPRFSQQNNSVNRVNNSNRLNTAQQFSNSNITQNNILNQDQEKAALIMQVLQLSDSQIAALPPEQRQNIMILKQQIQGPSVNGTT